MGQNYYFTFNMDKYKLAGYVNAENDIEVRKMFYDFYEVKDIFITPIDYKQVNLTLEHFKSEIARLKENGKSLGDKKNEIELYIEKLLETHKKSLTKLEEIKKEIDKNNVDIMVLEESLCGIVN